MDMDIPPRPDDLILEELSDLDLAAEADTPVSAKHDALPPPPAPKPQTSEISKPRPVPDAWVVQVGSFSKRNNADVLTDKLRAAGYTAFVDQTSSDSESMYRVKVGPLLTRDKAETLRDKLAKGEDLRGIVVKYP